MRCPRVKAASGFGPLVAVPPLPHTSSSCVPRCATDHNVDNTTAMLREWLAAVGDDYAAVVWRPEGEPRCGLRAKVLGKMGNRCSPERERDSSESQPPGQGSDHMRLPHRTSHLFTTSGPTQMKRALSTGPKKGISS